MNPFKLSDQTAVAGAGLSSLYGDAFAEADDQAQQEYDAEQKRQVAAQNLNNKTQQKLDKLNGKATTLLGMTDADTVITPESVAFGETNGKQGTIRVTSGYDNFDAVESVHPRVVPDGNGKFKEVYTGSPTEEIARSKRKKYAQPEYVSKLLGKPTNELTGQDYKDVAQWQTVQMLSNLANGNSNWKAPLIRGSAPINLTGTTVDENGNKVEAPLNIPIQYAPSTSGGGFGHYGRMMGSVGSADGTNTTGLAARDPKLSVNWGKQQGTSYEKRLTAEEAKRLKDAGRTIDPFIVSAVKNTASTFTSGFASAADAIVNDAPDWLIGKAEELYYDNKIADANSPEERAQLKADKKDAIAHSFKMNAVASYLGGDGWDDTKEYYTGDNIKQMTDDTFGVDVQSAAEDQKKIEDQWEAGDYIGAGATALTSGSVLGNVLGSVLQYMTGAGEIKAATAVAKNGGKVEKLLGMAKTAVAKGDKERVAKVMDAVRKRMTVAERVTAKAIERTGATAMLASTYNDILEARNEAKGQKHATAEDMAIALPMATLETMVGLEGAKIITTPVKSALKDMVGVLGKKERDTLWSKVLDGASKLAMAGGKGAVVEGTEEYLQQWADILGKQWNTGKKGDDILSIITNEKNRLDAGVSGIQGIAGAHVNVGTTALDMLGNRASTGKNKEAEPKSTYELPENWSTKDYGVKDPEGIEVARYVLNNPEIHNTDEAMQFAKNNPKLLDATAQNMAIEQEVLNNVPELTPEEEDKITEVADKYQEIDNIVKQVQAGTIDLGTVVKDVLLPHKEKLDVLDKVVALQYHKAKVLADREPDNGQLVERAVELKDKLVKIVKSKQMIEAVTKGVKVSDGGIVLNNRPIKEIDKDIVKVSNDLQSNPDSEDLKVQKRLLEIERKVSEATGVIPGYTKGATISQLDPGKFGPQQITKLMKLYGGVNKAGDYKKGLLQYAEVLLDPNIPEDVKEEEARALEGFLAGQETKLRKVEAAKEEYDNQEDGKKEPVEIDYGGDTAGRSTFRYNGKKSENFYNGLKKEVELYREIADAILSKNETENKNTGVENAERANTKAKRKENAVKRNETNSEQTRETEKPTREKEKVITPDGGNNKAEASTKVVPKEKTVTETEEVVENRETIIEPEKTQEQLDNKGLLEAVDRQHKKKSNTEYIDKLMVMAEKDPDRLLRLLGETTEDFLEGVNALRAIAKVQKEIIENEKKIKALSKEVEKLLPDKGARAAELYEDIKAKVEAYETQYKLAKDRGSKAKLTRRLNKTSEGYLKASRGKVKVNEDKIKEKVTQETAVKKEKLNTVKTTNVKLKTEKSKIKAEVIDEYGEAGVPTTAELRDAIDKNQVTELTGKFGTNNVAIAAKRDGLDPNKVEVYARGEIGKSELVQSNELGSTIIKEAEAKEVEYELNAEGKMVMIGPKGEKTIVQGVYKDTIDKLKKLVGCE